MDIHFSCNGQPLTVTVEPLTSLLDVLRRDAKLTGTKKGCNEGDCGACSVIVDGKLVNACLVMACKLEGAEVLTIEGLSANGELHPIQKAFIESGAIQCGYCTPGMIMATYALLQQNASPTENDIRQGLSGNLCRCTGYKKIMEAVQLAADFLRSKQGIDSAEGLC